MVTIFLTIKLNLFLKKFLIVKITLRDPSGSFSNLPNNNCNSHGEPSCFFFFWRIKIKRKVANHLRAGASYGLSVPSSYTGLLTWQVTGLSQSWFFRILQLKIQIKFEMANAILIEFKKIILLNVKCLFKNLLNQNVTFIWQFSKF